MAGMSVYYIIIYIGIYKYIYKYNVVKYNFAP